MCVGCDSDLVPAFCVQASCGVGRAQSNGQTHQITHGSWTLVKVFPRKTCTNLQSPWQLAAKMQISRQVQLMVKPQLQISLNHFHGN